MPVNAERRMSQAVVRRQPAQWSRDDFRPGRPLIGNNVALPGVPAAHAICILECSRSTIDVWTM
jgi:hypothetical protein